MKIRAKIRNGSASGWWGVVLALSLAAAIASPKISRAQGGGNMQGGAPPQQSPAPAPAPAPSPAGGTVPGAQGTAPGVKTAQQAYMNVTVLTDIPADQLVPSMEFIAASLGVRCNFCHVNPFQNDDKREKQTAREMIKLEMAINKMTFNGRTQVTCYTCHLGSPHPTGVPAIPEPGATPTMESMMGGGDHDHDHDHAMGGEGGDHPMPPMGSGGTGGTGGAPGANAPSQAPAANPTVDQILDKYTAALGGADAIAKLTSIDASGTLEGQGSSAMAVESVGEAPNKQWVMLQTKDGMTTMGFDGSAAWQVDPAGQVHDVRGNSTGAGEARRGFAAMCWTCGIISRSCGWSARDQWTIIVRTS